MTGVQLYKGSCVDILHTLPDASIDALITDPPYPEIKRSYGKLTETEWWDLMMEVCSQAKRLLKPTGSAVFILQANSQKIGKMRGWLWEFMAWVCREWNMVQDVYWWNVTAIPNRHSNRRFGLMRPSIKPCVWAGNPDCYRAQENVLWSEAQSSAAMRQMGRALHKFPSGYTVRRERIGQPAVDREGVTPFNLIPLSVIASDSAGAHGHGAGTPLLLANWWTRYICPPGGTVLDPFSGSATMGIAALTHGCSYIGIDKEEAYIEISKRRLATMQNGLFDSEVIQPPCGTTDIGKSDLSTNLPLEYRQTLGMGGHDALE